MKYTIFNFQQQQLINNDLNLEDALLLERLIFLSGIHQEQIINGIGYKWVAYSRIKKEIPIIATSDSKIKRMMSKLESKNLIKREYRRCNNTTKVLFHFTENVYKLCEYEEAANRPEVTGELTGHICTPTNRPEVTGDTSGFDTSGIYNKEVIHTTNYLFSKIMENKPNAYINKKPNVNKWYKDIDNLIRIDKAILGDIIRSIDFATKDNFWRSNILSANKFRKQYTKLEMQSRKTSNEIIGYRKY